MFNNHHIVGLGYVQCFSWSWFLLILMGLTWVISPYIDTGMLVKSVDANYDSDVQTYAAELVTRIKVCPQLSSCPAFAVVSSQLLLLA